MPKQRRKVRASHRAVFRAAESERASNIRAARLGNSNFAQGQNKDRRQLSGAGRIQAWIAKVFPRLRLAGQSTLPDAGCLIRQLSS